MYTEIISREIRDRRFKSIKTLTPHTFIKFVNTFIDKPNYGTKKGEIRKSIDTINCKLEVYQFKPRELGKININSYILSRHLKAIKDYYVYYCNRPFTQYPLVCIDIDALESTTEDDLNKLKCFLIHLFPVHSLYLDNSTSGTGLHIYFFIDFSTLISQVDIDLAFSEHSSADSSKAQSIEIINTAENKNRLIKELSDILKDLINKEKIKVKFDAIKATISKYSLENNLTHTFAFYKLIDSGVLCKLPCPKDSTAFVKLLNLNPVNIPSLITDIKKKNPTNNTILHNTLIGENQEIKSKTKVLSHVAPGQHAALNKEESDAFERSKTYGFMYFREVYRREKRVPTVDEFRLSYRNKLGTGPETEQSRKRLEQVYEYVFNGFRPDKVKSKRMYIAGQFLEPLNQLTTKAELDNWTGDNFRCKDRISIKDLEIGLGYYFVKITQSQALEDKNLIGSVPVLGLRLFAKKIYPKKIAEKKCQLIKKYLLYLGLIELVDDSYIPNYKANQFKLTDKFYTTFKIVML